MPYTIADRTINLEDHITEEEKEFLLCKSNMFKYCLNSSSLELLLNLKKIVHLYTDIFTIYSTLLRKIPNYDDITFMINRTKLSLLKLEEDFNHLLGKDVEGDRLSWEDASYDSVKRIALLCLLSCQDMFGCIIKNLNCVDIFFGSFNNLRKLLIPVLLNQSQIIQRSLDKSIYLFKLTTIADDLGNIDTITPPILKQMRKIEKVTSGIKRETRILITAFVTFDPSLKEYTSILLGQAILKRTLQPQDCELIARRRVCFQAAEHVVSIPLTVDPAVKLTMKYASKYVTYAIIVLVLLVGVMFYRLFKILLN